MIRSCLVSLVLAGISLAAAQIPDGGSFTNSIGMHLRRVAPGSFAMGVEDKALPKELPPIPHLQYGDFDERPLHTVRISKPFFIAAFEVTNAQYEQFDPAHRSLRGKLGFSKADDEAVVFVNWNDAVRFCRWLSEKEKRPYRLPTEAEWEYSARAGSNTPFFTGATLPDSMLKHAVRSWYPDPGRSKNDEVVPLFVGKTPPNPWGLYDMHGNVEEWVHDWYGPYIHTPQVDPVGRVSGDFRVTRGGSHSTEPYYLRSANRMGMLPDDSQWLTGFRVVLGEMPATKPLPAMPPERYQLNVRQQPPANLGKGPDPSKPYFKGPRMFVKIAPGSHGPLFFDHNHDTALAACPNGDLLAVWFSCVEEAGREMTVAVSRLRYGSEEWEPASPFWDVPDRNDSAPALWFDGDRTLYHFNAMGAAATWGNPAIIVRTSTDNGVTWSAARFVATEHGPRNMPVQSVIRTREGFILVPADAPSGIEEKGSALHISRDNGRTWADAGGTIAGIHAGVVQLKDGKLLAFGRGADVDGHMPQSVSADMGKTWTTTASPFPPIGGGQRHVVLRLKEGPIFLASFAKDMPMAGGGAERRVTGIFGAVSFDEGRTWPVMRVITDDLPDHIVRTMDAAPFRFGPREVQHIVMSPNSSEVRGYMSVCQTADGVIQLISSRQHYAFNLAWLKARSDGGSNE
ncbi:MAG: SUMF1/EgtB/PvdO family nonheme iron enzyme [Acidobacteriota bacterium]